MQFVSFKINGLDFNPPVRWQQLEFVSKFDDDIIETTLNDSKFVFTDTADGKGAYKYIVSHIDGGINGTTSGIFQGLPFEFTVSESGQDQTFNGFLDLTTIEIIDTVTLQVGIGRLDARNIVEKLQSITFLKLQQDGFITPIDYTTVKYLVEKEFVAGEALSLAIITFLLAKETAERIRSINEKTTELIAALGEIPPQPSQIAKISVLLALDVVYATIIVIALIKLLKEAIDFVFPPVREHKGITLLKALQKSFEYYGYTFSSPIDDLKWVYVPSKPDGQRLSEGIPNVYDYGYRCSEMLDLCKQMFNAKIYADDVAKTVELRSLNDPFWRQNSSFVMTDVLEETKQYNTDKLIQTRIIEFATDPINFWTVQSYKGTAYEVTTEPITPSDNEYRVIRGLDSIKIPMSLGVRKDGYTEIERSLIALTNVVDGFLGLFGASTGLSSKLKNRAGLIRQGTRFHSIPQLVLLEGDRVPKDYRNRLSAKYLYENYINQKSLIANNFFEQTIVFDDAVRPMDLAGFKEAIKNKYFTLSDGRQAEFNSIVWTFDSTQAVVDYEVHEVYTKNLRETGFEQD